MQSLSSEHPFQGNLDVASMGQAVARAAHESRHVLAGAAIAAGILLVSEGRLARVAEGALSADSLPMMKIVGEVGGEQSDLSYANLVNQMQKRNIGIEDLSRSFKRANFEGKGSSSEVFGITKLENYVLRKPLGVAPKMGPLTEISDIFPGENIGQQVAQSGNVQILRRQPGEQLIGPRELQGRALQRALHAQTRVLATNVPQTSFDSFAQTLSRMNERGLYFDPCPSNIMLDDSTLRLGLVDAVPKPFHDYINTRELMETAFLPHGGEYAEPFHTQVVDKIALAAKRAKLPD